MKPKYYIQTLTAFLLLTAPAYSAETTTTNVVGDLTTTITERTDKEGRLELRSETTSRGKEKVLTALKIPGQIGSSRSYYAGGRQMLTENDQDSDGVFETIYLQNPATGDLEMFHRSPDGAVTPVSRETLAAGRKGYLLGLETRVDTLKEILAKDLPEKEKNEWRRQLKEDEDVLAKSKGKSW